MDLIEKVRSGIRLNQKDGEALYDLDLMVLGAWADTVRRKRYGTHAYFNINRHINPTNICADVCKFCAYSASRKNPHPYAMSADEIAGIARQAWEQGAKEVHIVSAHYPDGGLAWYLDAFRAVRRAVPSIHIKAMTAAEVDYIHRRDGVHYEAVLDAMIEAGVDSMPGGGAEIFDEQVRQYLCRGKVSSRGWLDIHRQWHRRKKHSNATMLFGHVETRAHRIDHMLRLRDLQDETGGFNAFIPLVYQRENNFLNVQDYPTGQEILKTYAISRILLDNIPHIKAYWATSTIGLALIAQEFGADDLDGTIQKESIQSAAGASSAEGIVLEDFVALIRNAGFTPVERDSLYNTLKIYG